tara:strand:- start:12065 stop:12409 length:345 start_codon:yes stop_codon:yes gene_type:complete
MNLKDYVVKNQKIVAACNDRVPGNTYVDMLFGTLDFATARFHTCLIKLSQDKIKEVELANQVEASFDAIQNFYHYTKKYQDANIITQWVYKIILHGIGRNKIPKVKKLLNSLNN